MNFTLEYGVSFYLLGKKLDLPRIWNTVFLLHVMLSDRMAFVIFKILILKLWYVCKLHLHCFFSYFFCKERESYGNCTLIWEQPDYKRIFLYCWSYFSILKVMELRKKKNNKKYCHCHTFLLWNCNSIITKYSPDPRHSLEYVIYFV